MSINLFSTKSIFDLENEINLISEVSEPFTIDNKEFSLQRDQSLKKIDKLKRKILKLKELYKEERELHRDLKKKRNLSLFTNMETAKLLDFVLEKPSAYSNYRNQKKVLQTALQKEFFKLNGSKKRKREQEPLPASSPPKKKHCTDPFFILQNVPDLAQNNILEKLSCRELATLRLVDRENNDRVESLVLRHNINLLEFSRIIETFQSKVAIHAFKCKKNDLKHKWKPILAETFLSLIEKARSLKETTSEFHIKAFSSFLYQSLKENSHLISLIIKPEIGKPEKIALTFKIWPIAALLRIFEQYLEGEAKKWLDETTLSLSSVAKKNYVTLFTFITSQSNLETIFQKKHTIFHCSLIVSELFRRIVQKAEHPFLEPEKSTLGYQKADIMIDLLISDFLDAFLNGTKIEELKDKYNEVITAQDNNEHN